MNITAIPQIVFGVIFGVYLCINVLMQVPWMAFLYCTVFPFFPHAYTHIVCFVQGSWLTSLVFYMETVLGLQIRLTGDPQVHEPALVLSNHLTHDWIAIYCQGIRSRSLGVIRTVIKKSLLLFPGFGLGMWVCQWPFVTRNYKRDKTVLAKLFNRYKAAGVPVQLWIFPEGTRMSKQKLKESQEHQQAKGYPVWNNVLLPRHRGFILALDALQGVIGHVNEMTIWFEGYKSTIPGIVELCSEPRGKKHVLHLHQKRVPIAEVPLDEEGRQKWLQESFARKESLLEYRKKNGHFPGKPLKDPITVANTLPHILGWAVMFVIEVAIIRAYFF